MKAILKIILIIPALLITAKIEAQYLMESSRHELALPDSQKVIIFSARECQECFYYLPVNFRFSENKDGVPEVSFVSWKNDEGSETIGAILHFLTVWGLSSRQEEALQKLLVNEVDSNGVIMGEVLLESMDPQSKLELKGEDDYKEIFEEALTSQSFIATTPGGKMAMSFKFDEESVKPIMKLLSKPEKIKTILQIELKYKLLSADHGIPFYKTLKMELPLAGLFSLIQQKH